MMKAVFLLSGLILSGLCSTQAGASSEIASPNLTFTTFYAPKGFDDNDNAQIVAEGRFPNTCYRQAAPTVTIDQKTKTVQIHPNAYIVPGVCLQMIVQYSQVINLGQMGHGDYKIQDSTNQRVTENLYVAIAASAATDDFLYAPIQQATVESNGHAASLILTGTFTNSCLDLNDVRLDMQEKVLVVRPIAQAKNLPSCRQGQFPFKKEIALSDSMHGHYLLHVRSMSGGSLNSVIDVE